MIKIWLKIKKLLNQDVFVVYSFVSLRYKIWLKSVKISQKLCPKSKIWSNLVKNWSNLVKSVVKFGQIWSKFVNCGQNSIKFGQILVKRDHNLRIVVKNRSKFGQNLVKFGQIWSKSRSLCMWILLKNVIDICACNFNVKKKIIIL